MSDKRPVTLEDMREFEYRAERRQAENFRWLHSAIEQGDQRLHSRVTEIQAEQATLRAHVDEMRDANPRVPAHKRKDASNPIVTLAIVAISVGGINALFGTNISIPGVTHEQRPYNTTIVIPGGVTDTTRNSVYNGYREPAGQSMADAYSSPVTDATEGELF